MTERFLRVAARNRYITKLVQHLRNRPGYLGVILHHKNSTGT